MSIDGIDSEDLIAEHLIASAEQKLVAVGSSQQELDRLVYTSAGSRLHTSGLGMRARIIAERANLTAEELNLSVYKGAEKVASEDWVCQETLFQGIMGNERGEREFGTSAILILDCALAGLVPDEQLTEIRQVLSLNKSLSFVNSRPAEERERMVGVVEARREKLLDSLRQAGVLKSEYAWGGSFSEEYSVDSLPES